MSRLLSVIIPAYNEAPTLEKVVRAVRAAKLPEEITLEIILVDDGSDDGTLRVAKSLDSPVDRIIRHKQNRGKGRAIKSGLKAARGEFVLIQDADLEYDPRNYPELLQPLLENDADVVYGSRFVTDRPRRVLYYWHSIGNKAITHFSNMITNLNLSDMMTGYKAFRRDMTEGLDIEESRFGFEAEFTAKMAKQRARIYEVGITYHGRSYQEGKKVRLRDALVTIRAIVKYGVFGGAEDVGRSTLERLETYGGYSKWIFRELEPHLGNRVLEFGSGLGSLARLMLDKERIFLTDLRPDYVRDLKSQFGDLDHVEVHRIDITNPPREIMEKDIDTVMSSNVVEHIEDDRAALRGAYSLLNPGGRVVILVPAFMALYSPLDKNLEHYRRYTKKMMAERLESAGFVVEKMWYMNLVGGVGWFVAGRFFRQGVITDLNIALHKVIEPISHLADRITTRRRPFGLSLIAVARKPE